MESGKQRGACGVGLVGRGWSKLGEVGRKEEGAQLQGQRTRCPYTGSGHISFRTFLIMGHRYILELGVVHTNLDTCMEQRVQQNLPAVTKVGPVSNGQQSSISSSHQHRLTIKKSPISPSRPRRSMTMGYFRKSTTMVSSIAHQ